MASKAETLFRQNKVIPFLKGLSNTHYRPIQQQTIRGDPDFILCVRGWFVSLELKTDVGAPEPLQMYKMSCDKQAGGIAMVAKPSNWGEVSAFLKLLDEGVYDQAMLRRIEPSFLSDGCGETGPDEDE
jgi:hypothetical protein